MKSGLFTNIFSILLLSLGVIGTTILGSSISNNQVWADVIEGTEGPDFIVGTPEDDIIDSKGGNDRNFGDAAIGNGSGDDVILSGEGNDENYGEHLFEVYRNNLQGLDEMIKKLWTVADSPKTDSKEKIKAIYSE